jgi:predicted dehydrogenase
VTAPFRLGIIGCGWIAGRHAAAATALDDVAFVACADVRRETADAWAGEHSCERAYADYSTMVGEHDLDGVVIATWPNLHREQVLACIDARVRHILCEKSLALSGPEALEIWTAARAAGAMVTEAFMYRHHPAIAQLDELIEADAIGSLDHVSAAFDLFDPEEVAPDDAGRDWRQNADRAGGVPWDLASYCVDACNRYAGARPVRASSLAGKSRRYGTVNRLHGLLEYENGVIGQVQATRRASARYDISLAGTDGRLLLPVAWLRDGPAEIFLTKSRGWGEFDMQRYPVEAADSFALQLEAFVAAARGEREPAPSLAESVVTAFTLDALLASGVEREIVDVELPDEAAA